MLSPRAAFALPIGDRAAARGRARDTEQRIAGALLGGVDTPRVLE
jgi:hypothetical protein